MKSLFIFFTNPKKLLDLNHKLKLVLQNLFYEGNRDAPKLNAEKPFHYTSTKGSSSIDELINFNKPEVFLLLAYDIPNNDKIEKLVENIYKFCNGYEEVYIVYHSNMNSKIASSLKKKLEKNQKLKGYKRGKHEEDAKGCEYYTAAIDLLNLVKEDNNEKLNDRLDELKNLLGEDAVLNQKLNLLHKCLTPEGAEEVEKELANNKSDHEEIKDEVKTIKYKDRKTENIDEEVRAIDHLFNLASKGKDSFDKDYNYQLSHLRDSLLSH